MRLYLINPSNPLVSIVKVKKSRWNRYRVWKPLSLMVLAGLTPPEWEISIVDENLGVPDYPAMLSLLFNRSKCLQCATNGRVHGLHATRILEEVVFSTIDDWSEARGFGNLPN